VQKSVLLAAIQKEIQRHDLSYFVDNPPSVAAGGRGVVVAGCPTCRKRINTISQFLDHLTKDALPPLIGWRLETGRRNHRVAKGVALSIAFCRGFYHAPTVRYLNIFKLKKY
jgi:hypothetical protein